MLVVCNLVFDYARIRIVVEDRRSALGALAAGFRFVRRNRRSCVLYLLNGVLFLAARAALRAGWLPAPPRSGIRDVGALAVGEVYILGRHYLKLLFYASETRVLPGRLAHADYTAAPAVVWPESPAAESDPQRRRLIPMTRLRRSASLATSRTRES